MSFRDDVLAALDVRAFYEARVKLLGMVGPDEHRIQCPFHEDRDPSANVNLRTGLWKCQAENEGGGPIDWLMRSESIDARAAIAQLAELTGVIKGSGRLPSQAAPADRHIQGGASTAAGRGPVNATTRATAPSKLSEDSVAGWAAAALRNAELMAWFADKRGFTPETVRQWELGWDGERVTIPIRDGQGKLVNVRRYLRNSGGEKGKMLSITAGAGEARLWPLPLADSDVILCEGEWDTILMRQHGFVNALTVTSGAGIFKPEWVPLFAGHMVTLLYDNDLAGRNGAIKVARHLSGVTNVFVAQIPGLPEKGDPTDFFVEQSRSADELRALIADAAPYIVSSVTAPDDGTFTTMALHAASDARSHGKRLEIPVLVSGKAMTPYTIPAKWRTECDMSNKRLCGICPLNDAAGIRDVTITARDPKVLSLINVSDDARDKAMQEIAEAVASCNRPHHTVTEWANVEELRLIPELDATAEGDTEYVSRQGFLIGHGTASNRGYLMRGYAHPHPKTQATVHLLSEAIPAQDNIGSFVMTPEHHESLKVFQVGSGVEARFRDIYNDFAATVHRIQDRFDMQVAYDLTWHSVIAFTFNGAYVRRGWVEAMVMSDSGQGKSEMAHNLLRHYRLGERVQSEQSSSAGLLGGLEKMGDTWLLSWGRLPLNDKRLLVIDESQGLPSSAIEGLSDVRASGVAEITKIRTERTNARCRILWLANPVSGLTLSQHNQGVLAIKELFKKPEDIRRLDLAVCMASGDVDYAKAINVLHGAATEPRYGSDASRLLVLWAWSRRPDQVVFTEDAVDEILRSATEQGRKYHASIPLVEPSDQRLKLARLAASAAARVFSTDESGEQLIVGLPHVRFIVDYLDRVYNARAMSYGEYSIQHRRGESVEGDEETDVRSTMDRWEQRDGAIDFFSQARVFTKSELEDVVGWDSDYIKAQLRYLASHRLIRTSRTGYVKTPAFISLLRTFSVKASVIEDINRIAEGAAF